MSQHAPLAPTLDSGSTDSRLIVLGAGGTGGHMFPAETLAHELLGRGHRVALVTDRRGETFGDADRRISVHRIRSATVGAGVIGKIRTAFELSIGYFQARRLLKSLKPDVVVGFGGYPSVPTVAAAGRMGIPVMLHEQNALIGRANRMLSRYARRIATAFPEVAGLPDTVAGRTVMTGNPVRVEIAHLGQSVYHLPEPDGPIEVLVLGGSQGARALSEIVPHAMLALPEDLRGRLTVAQQCRPEDLELARVAYANSGIAHELASFFTDVPERLHQAHLVIARAGASTVAELTAAGRPAILVPYPFAMDDHQTANARSLERQGAGWMMAQDGLTADLLARRIEDLLRAPENLAEAARAARDLGIRDAGSRLADAVMALVGSNGGTRTATAGNSEVAA